jgi:hypothetical protein
MKKGRDISVSLMREGGDSRVDACERIKKNVSDVNEATLSGGVGVQDRCLRERGCVCVCVRVCVCV